MSCDLRGVEFRDMRYARELLGCVGYALGV